MRSFRLIAFLCLMAFALNSGAYQSRFLMSSLGNVCENSDPKNIVGSFKLKNISDQTVEIRVAPLRNDTFDFRFVAEQKVLQPQAETTVHIRGAIHADGKYQVNVRVEMMRPDGSSYATHDVDFYYLVVKERAQASNYETLYLQRDILDKTIGDSFSVVEDDGKLNRGIEYKQPLPTVERMIKMDPNSIHKIPTDSATPDPCTGRQCPCPSPNPGPTNPNPTPIPKACMQEPSLKSMPVEYASQERAPVSFDTIAASGVFSFKGMDSSLHPAFGWRVRAWRNIPGSGWTNVAAKFGPRRPTKSVPFRPVISVRWRPGKSDQSARPAA